MKVKLPREKAIEELNDIKSEEDTSDYESMTNEELEREICLSGLFTDLYQDLEPPVYEDDLEVVDRSE